MACSNEIHKDDIGTEFVVSIVECINGVDVAVDISTATAKEIIFLKSDDITRLAKVAEFTSIASGGTGNGSDGKISYFSIAGDLDQLDKYKIQGIVTTPVGKWYSTIDSFKVIDNL